MNTTNLDTAFFQLLKDSRIFNSTIEESASIIAKHCTDTLSVSRASVWISYDNKSVLTCLSLYCSDTDTYQKDAVITEEAFPGYFEALGNSRVIGANNTFEDPRTRELSDSYLKPLDVRSLLDATIRHHGTIKGVLCLEMVGEYRTWQQTEEVFIASVADLISLRIVEAELMRSEEKYKGLYDYTSEGICVFGGQFFVDVNPATCTMFGGKREEIVGKTPMDLSPEFQSDGQPSEQKAMKHIQACLAGTPQNFEWIHSRLDGTEFHADVTLNAVRLEGEDTLFALIRDISDKKEAEHKARVAKEKLAFRATHDSLTGLLNREQLHDHVDSLIGGATDKRSDSQIALLLLDLNRFKEVNDTLGHATGDQVLIKLANILKNRISEIGGFLFRLGGDEFVAVFESKSSNEEFGAIEAILHQALKTSIDLDDIQVEMGASIGIALFPQHGSDSHELLRCADVAMYHAKGNDGTSSWYDPQNDLNNKRRLAMIVEFSSGIEDNQLLLHYQPRIDIQTGQVTGCEALVRWSHPKHGMMPPDEFIPLAEMTELIHPLSAWVLGEVIRKIKQLTNKGHHVPIAMNVSARNLIDSRLVDKLEQQITQEHIEPGLLEVEITESALINHPQRAMANLEKLDQLGVPIAIDDFGTGYSSLNYLKKLPLNTLKIDRSFVGDMLSDESDSVIVESTIDLAHNFSLTVVAEGVEDQATLDALAAKGCDQAQGFFIARPMESDAFDEWLFNYYQGKNRSYLAA